jgi:hypothetical protein
VNTVATRAASLALLSLVALAATVGPAAARRENAPVPEPTATPIYAPMTTPTLTPATGVAMAQPGLTASSVCQNDRFLAQRAVPVPQRFDVSVCGWVYAVNPGDVVLAIDGTRPIRVTGKDVATVHVGDSVLVVGTYSNSAKSVEHINATGGVSPLPAATTPTST